MASNSDWKKAAVKAAKARDIAVPSDIDVTTNILGPAARALFIDLKKHAGIHPHDDRLDQHLQHFLAPYLPPQPKVRTTPRQRLVNELHWGINNKGKIGYAEIRPIPIHSWKAHRALVTDCSGAYTAACFAAGLPDPNGMKYDGSGWTETLVHHMRHVTRSTAKAGDAVLFGSPTVHVLALLEAGANHDPMVFNHGHAGPPDEPAMLRLSVMLDYFSGYPVTYCSPT